MLKGMIMAITIDRLCAEWVDCKIIRSIALHLIERRQDWNDKVRVKIENNHKHEELCSSELSDDEFSSNGVNYQTNPQFSLWISGELARLVFG